MTALGVPNPAGSLRLVGDDAAPRPVTPLHPAELFRGRTPFSEDWLPLDEAAELLGVSVGHLRREAPDLARRSGGSLARKQRTPGRRNESWFIRRAYSKRLCGEEASRFALGVAASALAAPRPSDALAAATGAQRAAAELRATVLVEWRAWRLLPGVQAVRDFPRFRDDIQRRMGAKFSRASLYGWHQQAPSDGADFREIAAALLDGRAEQRTPDGAGGGGVSAEAWAMFEGLYLQATQPSMAKCHRVVSAAAVQHGWSWPTSASRIRQLVRERIDPAAIAFARHGEKTWAREFKAPIAQNPDAWAPGERADFDHARLDFFVRVQRGGAWVADRPWLTAIIDWRTRTLRGWRIGTEPNSRAVKLALLSALRPGADAAEWGPPAIAWLDNGKDFASAAITGETKSERRAWRTANAAGKGPARVGGAHGWAGSGGGESEASGLLRQLGIEPHFAQPYNHNGKARVERFFGFVHSDFDKEQPSWCGSNPEANGAAPNVRDRDSLREVVGDVMSLLTIEQVRERFAEWARWYNRRADHSIEDLTCPTTGERLSPLAYLERHAPARRVLPDAAALALLEQEWSRPLAVGKRGVGLKIAGRTIHYGDLAPALEPLKNTDRRVLVSFDPADLSSIRVYDEASRFLCVAQANEQFGGAVSTEALKIAHQRRAAQRRRAKERIDLSALTDSAADAAYRAQRQLDIEATNARLAEQRGAASLPGGEAAAPQLRIVRTPLDGQAERVERAEMRKAAGAEGMRREGSGGDDAERMPVIDRLAAMHRVRDGDAGGAGDDCERIDRTAFIDAHDDEDEPGGAERVSLLDRLP